MSKRGERKPWKVRFEWSNGIKGIVPYSSRDLAEIKADQIRRHGACNPEHDVTVRVEHRPHTTRGESST